MVDIQTIFEGLVTKMLDHLFSSSFPAPVVLLPFLSTFLPILYIVSEAFCTSITRSMTSLNDSWMISICLFFPFFLTLVFFPACSLLVDISFVSWSVLLPDFSSLSVFGSGLVLVLSFILSQSSWVSCRLVSKYTVQGIIIIPTGC